MATLEAIDKSCTQLFEQTMELWTLLQEDPYLQKLEEKI